MYLVRRKIQCENMQKNINYTILMDKRPIWLIVTTFVA